MAPCDELGEYVEVIETAPAFDGEIRWIKQYLPKPEPKPEPPPPRKKTWKDYAALRWRVHVPIFGKASWLLTCWKCYVDWEERGVGVLGERTFKCPHCGALNYVDTSEGRDIP